MGNKKATKRITARRAATFLAAIGALVMSSGVALMATSTSANAAPADKIVVCKYVSTPGGHLDHIVVVSANTLPDGFDGTFPFVWTDAQGQSEHGSIAVRVANPGEQAKDVPLGDCPQAEEPDVATADVTFTNPTCDNGNVASYSTSGENVTFDSPTATPGTMITVTATATGDAEFDGGGTQATFDHTYPAAEVCSSVTPPVVSPPVVSPPKHHTQAHATVTPTVVHAGLAGVSTQDMRSEQGLALMFAGMLMLVAAGGLGLRLRGESRI
jgi:hypothetical protein